jgi:DNA-binding transcriptional ArsR family regulator
MNTEADTKKINAIRSLCTPNRMRILSMLREHPACVCEMVAELDMKHNLLSHHLSVLSEADFVYSTRNGRHISYGIMERRKPCVDKLLSLVRNENCSKAS